MPEKGEGEANALEGPEKIRVQQRVDVKKNLVNAVTWVGSIAKAALVFMRSGMGLAVLSAVRLMAWIKQSPKARFYLKTGLMSVVCIWLAFFMVSTVAHLFKSRAVEKGAEKQLEIQVPRPFTIQVAAYLKQSHADRYVAALRKKDIDARVKQAAGGGKTWYLVQVSAFVDKKSAETYGNKLKAQKMIDYFFVNNR